VTVRLGLLAAARITDDAVVAAAPAVDGVDIVAVAARSHDRAAAAASRWGIGAAFGSYEAMLESDEVDAVYVATPAALHRAWTLAALEAGKHVLVEKPLAANADDARTIQAAAEASDRVVMVAFHWRYHPLVSQMDAILESGVLGAVQRVDAVFEVAASLILPTDIRWELALGGGATMDIGCYPAAWVRHVTDGEPEVVSAEAQCPVPGVDGALTAELAWPGGVTGSIRGSMLGGEPSELDSFPGHVARLVVRGSAGTMEVSNPLAPQHGASLVVTTASGTTEHPVVTDTTYSHQLAAFRDAVVDGAPFPTTVADGVATMELIDACYLAAGMEPRPTYG
jgi:predicted dehydrogenase